MRWLLLFSAGLVSLGFAASCSVGSDTQDCYNTLYSTSGVELSGVCEAEGFIEFAGPNVYVKRSVDDLSKGNVVIISTLACQDKCDEFSDGDFVYVTGEYKVAHSGFSTIQYIIEIRHS